ncbi:chaperone protein ClpD, chloroplastic-like [Glycine soja]|uniref:Chaperone protein ClpD, chloroplastic isoform A n=1 Tax=Glycine soja TaxID=3848 RepID=A0A445KAJ3_GLYSO|nr:chaperone protein ClpD, chloroplastic-like [Glycine soja]RZC07822.1 Chaperone protein ClpD, chloroplastic isoform A [Glycine soja]
MQVSSSWFGTIVLSNRYSRNRSLPLEPCSTTTTSSVSATSYPPLFTRPYSSLSFLVSQRKGFTLTSLSPIRTNKKRRRASLRVSAVFERFTERAIKAIVLSQREAKALGSELVYTQHLLLGLIAEEDRSTDGFLASGVTVEKAREVVRSVWLRNGSARAGSGAARAGVDDDGSKASATQVPFSVNAKRVFEAAFEYSKSLGHKFVGPEHITVGLVKVDDGSVSRVLYRLGTNGSQLASVAFSRLQKEIAKDGREPNVMSKGVPNKSISRKGSDAGASATTGEESALSQFCVDLTARASEGRIDPVVGREVEVQRIIQILCRKTKSNPILLGEAGVGKTAIAEGMALRIAKADVAPFLLTKRVMSLDIALLMAGAKERGELEERVTKLVKDIIKSGDVILFIDEVHILVQAGTIGRGNKGSGLDIANLLKPALGRGQFQCIASTTLDEYRLYFEKDTALARRFQPVWVDEPTEDDAIKILTGLREKYEAHHKCRYTAEAIKAAVDLSARYIVDRYLPDKAIDLIDEAGSRACIEAFKKKKEHETGILSKCPADYWQEIKDVKSMHEMENKLKYYGASSIDDTNELILDSYLSSTTTDNEPIEVGPEDIAAVASLWSGIPVQKLTADQRILLLDLENQLRKRVIGQEEAVAAISRAVKRSRVGLKDPDRPIAAMLFCGPTGVGKTELAKSLAACYFGSEAAMVRLDMSEYMERHTVSKLIGSPPGYVGYGEGGVLTEAIRRKPFTLLLLDEIEKAHPDIFNILLQILEDGQLTDSQGRRVSFKNALVVMTSNVGSSAIAKGRHNSIGFLIPDDKTTSYNGLKSMVIEELRSYFRPELLNRIDEVVVFQPLEKSQLLQILDLLLQDMKKRVLSLGVHVKVSEAVKNLVCQQGYNPTYGARPLRRAITSLIEDPLSEAFLYGECKQGDTVLIDLDANGNPFVTNQLDQIVNLSD